MKDLMYFCDINITLKDVAELYSSNEFFLSIDADEVYIADKENDWLFIKIKDNPSILDSYDKTEKDYIQNHVIKFKAFTCSFRDINFAKRIVSILISEFNGVVDNDFDELMSGEEFLHKMKITDEWDWTKPSM